MNELKLKSITTNVMHLLETGENGDLMPREFIQMTGLDDGGKVWIYLAQIGKWTAISMEIVSVEDRTGIKAVQ